MKILSTTFLALLFLASTLTFVSCGDDDSSDDALTTANLIGTWNMTKLETTTCVDSEDNEVITANADGQLCETSSIEYCQETSFTFTETTISTLSKYYVDGVLEEQETDVLTYTLSGDVITGCDTDGECNPITAQLSGNTLMLTDSSDPDYCTFIVTLTK